MFCHNWCCVGKGAS